MTALAVHAADRQHWRIAAIAALAGHGAMAALVLAGGRPADPPVPEPIVLVELPPPGAPAPAATAQQTTTPLPPEIAPPQAAIQPIDTPPIAIPPVRAPLPDNSATLPPPAPGLEAQAAPAPATAAAPAFAAPSSTAAGSDPRARQQAADYFALVSAHLNRRKVYPPEARKARQQGVVTIRFTVDRTGAVSAAAIKRSSGHDTLDRATLDLLQRVAPLPRMPSSLQRDRITLALPIDYSLRTN